MTGYTVHTGSTKDFSDGWDRIFQKPTKKKPKKKPAKKSARSAGKSKKSK
jgi:hypothetical protein